LGFIKQHSVLLVFIIAAIGIAGVTGKTYLDRQSQSAGRGFGSAPSVITDRVRVMELVDSIEAIGTALASESVDLTSKVTDTVSKVNFDDGDFVEAGDIIVELTNSEQTAMLAEAQATLNEASRQMVRVKDLNARNLAALTQLDEERARTETAQARYEGIVARLDDRLIRAPFSGVLGYRNVSPGTLLTQNRIVTTLDDINKIKLDFTIPEAYLGVTKPGQAVTAVSIAYPDRTFSGTVSTINSRVDPVTRAIGVRAIIDNKDHVLRSGMLLKVRLTRDTVTALVVPEEAIVPMQSKQYVYTISPQGTAQRLEVQTGRRRPGFVEVISGLEAGQEVITEGVIKVRPGGKVKRKGEDSASGSRGGGRRPG
jgi:membrane fusion protein (multidrug efflux system)